MAGTWWLPEPRTEGAAWTFTVVAGLVLIGVPNLITGAFVGVNFLDHGSWIWVIMGIGWLLGLLLPFVYGMVSPKPWAAPPIAAAVSIGFGLFFLYGPSREFSQGFEDAGGSSGFFLVMMLVSLVMGAAFTAGITLGGSFLGRHLRKKRAEAPEPVAPPTLPSFERVP